MIAVFDGLRPFPGKRRLSSTYFFVVTRITQFGFKIHFDRKQGISHATMSVGMIIALACAEEVGQTK
jgi:hypothetical protein